MSADAFKRAAAAAAIELVENGMVLGIGTGSTAAHFIELLGARVRDGLQVTGVPTSEDTRRKADAAGIRLIEPDETTVIDLAIDGADEIDPRLALIKGGGGALLREKIIAHAARRFVIIADTAKRVATLGAFPLPVEIDRACWALTVSAVRRTLHDLGFASARIAMRPAAETGQGVFVSDGGHYILDCALGRIDAPSLVDERLRALPGVIETGLFIGMADEAFLAGPGGVERITAA